MKKNKSCSVSHENDVCSFVKKESLPDPVSEDRSNATDSCAINSAESGMDGYLCISPLGQILEVNEAYCRLSGYTEDELLGMTLEDLDVSKGRNNPVADLHDIIIQNKGRFDVTHRTKDGRLLDMEVSATYMERSEPFFIFILKDIGSLNSADRFSLGKGDTYRSLFTHNKAVMLVIDPETSDIVDANIAACKYYGWSLEEITRKKIHEINTLSPENVKAEMQSAVNEKRNHFLFKHRLASGEIRDVEVYSSPAVIKSQNLLFFIIHDITERKMAEEGLRTREMQLRTAQKIGHIGSWEFDFRSGMVDASEEARTIYGEGLEGGKYPITEIQKIPLPEYRPMLDEALRALVKHHTPYDVEFKIKRPIDGVIRDIHAVAEYYAERDTVIGTLEDVTERKMAEDALLHAKIIAEAANRSKDEFLATMSHELRTPLTSVIGFSDILLEETFGKLNEKQIRYVSHISEGGRQLLGLINDVLDLSKVEAGKMELQYEVFPVSNTIDEVKTLISPLAINKNIRLDVEIDPQLNTINADRTKFRQILFNLASNAIKFTPKNGSVSINAQRTGNMAHVSVKDTGLGISEEDVAKLFQPFKQLNSYATNEYAGTGLGLALVKKFVELHGGKVRVESKVGGGSTFGFSIPVGKVDEE